MTLFHTKLGAALACASLAVAAAGPAAASEASLRAENLRKFDIMLMVSSLRCRHGESDFQADYRSFSARHLPTLNAAYRTLHGNLARTHGAKGAKRQLDRISVGMANQYGQGHPWLSCSELKDVTRDLAAKPTGHDLHPTALTLLGDRAEPTAVLAGR